jgi:predicted transcriptional regulator
MARYRSFSGALRIQDETPAYDPSQMTLTPERIKKLAECIVAGCSRHEIADLLGVSPRTISRWKKDPRVIAEVERLRRRANEPRVEDVLIRLLQSDDEHIRLMAVRETLRWEIQRARVEPEPKPERPVEEGYIVVRQEPFR